jgi:hypothetical protein
MVLPIKDFIMKKMTPFILATCFMLSVVPSQIKAATVATVNTTETVSTETVISPDQLNEIKPIDFTAESASENKEVLRESSPLVNGQGRHNGRFNNRQNRDVDVTIQSDRTYGHRHGGAYIGGGGVIVLIIILILVL